jgi:hypothetical protein
MTNKDNANLHSVAFNNITSGEVLALIHALQIARTISPVALDLSSYLSNAFTAFQSTTGDQKAQEFWTELAGEMNVVVTQVGEQGGWLVTWINSHDLKDQG